MATAPHAYSSDTLQTAYQWLQQNPQYQESIHNSDQLVALYLSEKQGLQSFDFSPPTSASLFLDQTSSKPSINNISGVDKVNGVSKVKGKFSNTEIVKKQIANTFSSHDIDKPANIDTPVNVNTPVNIETPVNIKTKVSTPKVKSQNNTNDTPSFFTLDQKSLSYLEDTKKTFNLSTQSEALRLLLSIGYEKLHKV